MGKYDKTIIALIAGVTLFRLWFINLFPLLGDEAYYWQWARHLDWGYYEQGPMVAAVIFIFTLFTKVSTLFTIRLGAVVLSAATMYTAFLTYRKAYPGDDGRWNLFNLLLMSTGLIYALGSVTMMHDTVMVFFYSLFLYNLVHIMKEPDNNMHWGHAGIILGLGIMSKLTMGTVYIAMFLLLLLTGSLRRCLKGFIYFTLFTLLFTSPLICWNFTHDFATFRYLLVRGAPSQGFTLKLLGELLGSQIGLVGILTVAAMVPATAVALKKRGLNTDYAFATLAWACLIPFFILSVKSRVEANWPAFAFLPAFFLASSWLSRQSMPLRGRAAASLLAFGLVTAVAGHVITAIPLLPEKMNPLRKSMGYKELALKVHGLYNEMAEKTGKPPLLTARHYQTASLLSFYTPGQPEYYVLIKHESNKNYRFWKGYEKMKGSDALFVYGEQWESWENAKFYNSLVATAEVTVDTPPYGSKRFLVDTLSGLK